MKIAFLVIALPFFLVMLSCQSFAEQFKLIAEDGVADDQFGYSVAIDGTTALVGALNADFKNQLDAGAAYLYSLHDGGWQLETKLSANPANAGDTLGGNVALKRNFAILGASRRDTNGENSGAAFAFEKDEGGWSQKQVLSAYDASAGDAFGQSIALTEDFLVIGAPHSDAPKEDSGAVYVYRREGDRWTFQVKLTARDGAEGDLFGISVAIDSDTILVGADLNDEKAGAVYAFAFDGDKWNQQAKLMADDGADTDIFGVRVALFGDTALISARRDDIEGVGVDAGSAYIFERSQGLWKQKQKLVAPDAAADDRFARGVALNAETALITAMHHDANGNNAGAVYVFKKQLDKWQYSTKHTADDGSADDRFGWNVSLSGDTAIVATPHRDDLGNASGAAYIVNLND